jgi:hypothetical protein
MLGLDHLLVIAIAYYVLSALLSSRLGGAYAAEASQTPPNASCLPGKDLFRNSSTRALRR